MITWNLLGWDLGWGGESWADALEDDHDEVLYTGAQQSLLEGRATQATEETVVDPRSSQPVNMDDHHPPRDELHETLDDDLDPDQNFQNHHDEHTRLALDPMMVKKGRAKEIDKLKTRGVYEVVPRDQAKLGKMIRTRWVETPKGDEVRCRFVAQSLRKATPGTTCLHLRHHCLWQGSWSVGQLLRGNGCGPS